MFNIRPMEIWDLAFINETRNLVREFLHDSREFTLKETEDWYCYAKVKPEWYIVEMPLADFEKHFAVTEVINNSGNPFMIKLGYFRTKTIGQGEDQLEVGMDLFPAFQGRGWAVTAYARFFEYILEHRPERVLTLECLGNNIRAFNLYKKLGFEQYSYSEVERNGRIYPSIHMKMELEDEY